MRKLTIIFSLAAIFVAGSTQKVQAQVPDYRDMVTFGQYLQQHRKTYSAYAEEKTDLLKLSVSRDPAQITAEFQGKLSAITIAYQNIYQSNVAAFNAGVGLVNGLLPSKWQGLGGVLSDIVSGLFAGSAQKTAEEEAAQARALLTLEFEEKFITLKEEVLVEKHKLIDYYLMSAAMQLSESDEKKYLDLANHIDCECQYIESNFSLASTSWLNSNCMQPATSKYAYTVAQEEPTSDMLLATIKRKLSVPNVHFVRAARDFAEIGMAKFPKNSDFLFYRIYLSEDPDVFDDMLMEEFQKVAPNNSKTNALKDYYKKKRVANAVERLNISKSNSVGIAGNPEYILRKNQYVMQGGMVYPVMQNKKMIYVTPNGLQAFEGEYDFATIFKDGYARVMKKGLWGMIDNKGNIVIPCVYRELMPSINDYDIQTISSTNLNPKWEKHIISMSPFVHFDKGHICARTISGKYGVLSKDMKLVIEPKDENCPLILTKDRILRMEKKPYKGYIYTLSIYDANGKPVTIIEPKYYGNIWWGKPYNRSIGDNGWYKMITNKNLFVTSTMKWTFMNTEGEYAFGKKVFFDEIIDNGFKDGKCKVRNGNEIFYIDETGNKIETVGASDSDVKRTLGDFRKDLINRFGEFKFNEWNGDYSGYSLGDKMHSFGTFVMKDGTTKSGIFSDGEFIEGVVTDKNGKLIEIKK